MIEEEKGAEALGMAGDGRFAGGIFSITWGRGGLVPAQEDHHKRLPPYLLKRYIWADRGLSVALSKILGHARPLREPFGMVRTSSSLLVRSLQHP